VIGINRSTINGTKLILARANSKFPDLVYYVRLMAHILPRNQKIQLLAYGCLSLAAELFMLVWVA
jgi:hypothetical protein